MLQVEQSALSASAYEEPKPKAIQWVGAGLTIVTAVIGAGVLALPNALGNLGWIAGPICILGFAVVAYTASMMLAEVYDYKGQHGRYINAVGAILGPRHAIGCALVQNTNLVMLGVAYTITAATSMEELANIACGNIGTHTTGSDTGDCFNKTWVMTIIFGGVQIFASQFKNLEEAWLMSAVGGISSFGYSIIALVLSIVKVGDGEHHGTVAGIPGTPADKAFNVLNALGAVAFAYAFTVILLEIQDTIKEPPRAVLSMRRAINAALSVSVFFYLLVAVFGYLAFGDTVPSDIIVAFDGPKWAVILGQVFVLLHMVGAYQVFAQPFFVALEGWIFKWLKMPTEADGTHLTLGPEHDHLPAVAEEAPGVTDDPITKAHSTPMMSGPSMGGPAMSGALSGLSVRSSCPSGASMRLRRQSSVSPYRESSMLRIPLPTDITHETSLKRRYMLSIIIRCIYVCLTTLVACVLPFFGEFVGLVGAITFWPLSIYFPFSCYAAARPDLERWKVTTMKCVAGFMFVVAVGAVVGSVRNIIQLFMDGVTIF